MRTEPYRLSGLDRAGQSDGAGLVSSAAERQRHDAGMRDLDYCAFIVVTLLDSIVLTQYCCQPTG